MLSTEKLFNLVAEQEIGIEWYDLGVLGPGMYICNQEQLSAPIIALDNTLLTDERLLRCVLAHELGHHKRSSGCSMAAGYNHSLILSKAERMANDWALDALLPSRRFIKKLSTGMDVPDLEDEFFVTSEFVTAKFRQLDRRGYRHIFESEQGLFICYESD